MDKQIVEELKRADVELKPGERWAPVRDCPGFLVSTEGRAFRMAHTVIQRSRYGQMIEVNYPARLLTLDHRNPRLRLRRREKARAYDYEDLGRQVLSAFVRAPQPGDRAMRRNQILWDCRLENLYWSGDQPSLLERFLANEADCLDGHDLEHAAIRLGVSGTALGKALHTERERLGVGFTVASRARGPRKVAQVVLDARAAAQQQAAA